MSIKRRLERLEAAALQIGRSAEPLTWPFQWSDTGLPWNEGEEPQDLEAWCERHRREDQANALTQEMVSRVEAHYSL